MNTRIRREAQTLVERLRKLQVERHDCLEAGRNRQAQAAVHLMCDLLDDAGRHLHREALLVATEPPQAIPVVLGAQDRAAVNAAAVGGPTLDEVYALLCRYVTGVVEHAQGRLAEEQLTEPYNDLWQAIQGLHLVAFAGELAAQGGEVA